MNAMFVYVALNVFPINLIHILIIRMFENRQTHFWKYILPLLKAWWLYFYIFLQNIWGKDLYFKCLHWLSSTLTLKGFYLAPKKSIDWCLPCQYWVMAHELFWQASDQSLGHWRCWSYLYVRLKLDQNCVSADCKAIHVFFKICFGCQYFC